MIKKIVFALMMVVGIPVTSFAVVPVADEWTKLIGEGTGTYIYDVAVDGSGNSYVAGYTYGSFDGTQNAGDTDIVIAKYDSAGQAQWTKQLGGADSDSAYGVAVDATGAVYVTGRANYRSDYETHTYSQDFFVIKYDSSGELQWMQQVGSPGSASANDIAVGSDGSVYVVGDADGSLYGEEIAGLFIIKYNSAGEQQWIRKMGTGDCYFNFVAVGADGAVYATCSIYGGAGLIDVFVVKYDGAGVLEWARQTGTADDDYSSGVAVATDGSVYISGSTGVGIGNGIGLHDAFLVKYDREGILQWTRQNVTADNDFANNIAVSADGAIYLTGNARLFVGPQWPRYHAYSYVLKYNTVGDLLWTRQINEAYDTGASGIAIGAGNTVYVAGSPFSDWVHNHSFLMKFNDNVVPSLTCDKKYKEPAATPITWTATATGGSGSYQYQFWLYGPSTANKWAIKQDYSASSTWTWNTSASDIGANRVRVYVRNAGSSAAFEASMMSAQATTILPAPAVASTLTCDKTFKEPTGTAIKWTAAATGGAGSYQYEFWLYGPATGNTWQMKRAYSSTDNWTWTTSVADVGANRVKVNVRNAGQVNALDSMKMSAQATTVFVPVAPVTGATLVSDKSYTQPAGTAIKWTAQGQGGSLSYQYEFWLYGPSTGNTWQMKRGYSATPDWTWTTTAADKGVNRVKVNVRNAGATNAYDIMKLSAQPNTVQ